MAKAKSPRVTFKMERLAADDWQILAECPGVETAVIKGLKSKAWQGYDDAAAPIKPAMKKLVEKL